MLGGEHFVVSSIRHGRLLHLRSLVDGRSIYEDVESSELKKPLQLDATAQSLDRYSFMDGRDGSISENLIANNRANVFESYRANEITLQQALGLLGLSRSGFFRAYRRYNPDHSISSASRAVRGRKAGTKIISTQVEEIISSAVQKEYSGKSTTCAHVYREVVFLCSREGLESPSYDTVLRRIKLIPPKELHKAKHGSADAADKFGLKPGYIKLNTPFERVQMDHTRVDVILVDEITRKPIGRPWVTFVLDVYSRIILGFYISMHAPSALSVASALTMATFPKDKYLECMGVSSVQYPYHGQIKLIHMDNAAEFRSPAFVSACAANGISVEWRPIGKKHYGGHVERLVGTMMSTVHFLPGSTYSNVKQRGDYDSEGKAALTFDEFQRWFVIQIELYHNKHHKGLGKSPSRAWTEYFAANPDQSYKTDEVKDAAQFRLDFMPETRRTIGRKGVQLEGNFYSSPNLIYWVGTKNVVVKYDPYFMKKIWVKVGGEYICASYEIERKEMSLEQIRQSRNGRPTLPWDDIGRMDGLNQESKLIVTKAIDETKREAKKRNEISGYSQSVAAIIGKGEDFSREVDANSSDDDSYRPVVYNMEE